MDRIEVFRGGHKDPDNLFGPLPGYRHGNVVAYEFELPASFEPWPGRTRLERSFVLLDLGVSCANPCWRRWRKPDGSIATCQPQGPDSWYVDLISIERAKDTYTFLDLYIDVMVATDGRGYRVLDLDEHADAIAGGQISLAAGLDGLRRWQQFLDRHLHGKTWDASTWPDFPPKCIKSLQDLETPLGEIVTAPE